MSDALDTVSLYATAERIKSKLVVPSRDNYILTVMRILRSELHLDPPIAPITKAMMGYLMDIYELEEMAELPDKLPIQLANSLDGARYRDYLRSYIARWSDPQKTIKTAEDVGVSTLMRFMVPLPASLKTTWDKAFEDAPTTLTIPLHDLIPDLASAMRLFIVTFFHDELEAAYVYQDLRRDLLNLHNSYARSRRKPDDVFYPEDHDGRPTDIVRDFFGDTCLGRFFTTQVPFTISDDVRPEHLLMVASTGSGKTQFIQADILANLMRPDGPGMVVIDSQNQMIPKLERLQVARDRIVIIDPFDEDPPALNMFIAPERTYDPNLKEAIETATLEQFAWIFAALDQELSGRMTTLFTFTARILLAMAPRSNMMTLLDLLRIEKLPQLRASQFWTHIEQSDAPTRVFFEERFCTSDFNKTKGGVADRLLGVMRVPAFNRMFMATANRLDLYKELAARKLIVFNTQKRMLGEDASAVFGRYAISLYIRAALERESDRSPPLAFLYVDEASEYFGKKDSSDFLFTQLRKYNCGTFAAFQNVSQLGEQTGTLISNTTTKLAARLSPADAGILASSMRTSLDELLAIGKRRDGFEMACHIKDVTPSAVKLTFPYGAVENAPKLTASEHMELRAENRRRVGSQTQEPPRTPAVAASMVSPPAPDDDPSKAVSTDWLKK